MYKERKINQRVPRRLTVETLDSRLVLTSIILPPDFDQQSDEELAASIIARRPGISDINLFKSDDITAPVIEYAELDQIDTALAEFAINRWGILFGREVVPELSGSILSPLISSISTSSSLQDESTAENSPLNQTREGVQLPGIFQRLGSGHIIAASDGALTILDVSIPDSPTVVSRIDGVNVSELFVVGDALVTVSQRPASSSDTFSVRNNFEITLFDISNLTDIQPVDTLSLVGSSVTINVVNNELIVRHSHRIEVPDIQTVPLDDDPNQLRFETQDEYLSRVGTDLSRFAFSVIRNGNNENINLPSADDFVSVGAATTAFSTSFYKLRLADNQFELVDSETLHNLPTDSFVTTADGVLSSAGYFDVEQSEFRTQIWVLSLTETEIEFSSTGNVAGTLFNPESLDLSDGNVRVFTQSQDLADSTRANLTVLGASQTELQVVSEITDFGDGNALLAASFENEFAYATSFGFDSEGSVAQTLHVFDLTNSNNLLELGQTSAPGLLSYLQPITANRLLGVGLSSLPRNESSDANDSNGTEGQFEIVVFDLSDPTQPLVVDAANAGTFDFDSLSSNGQEIPTIDPLGIAFDEQLGRVVFSTTTAFRNATIGAGEESSEIIQVQFDSENSVLDVAEPIEIAFEPRLFAQYSQALVALGDDRLATIVTVNGQTDVTVIRYDEIDSSGINLNTGADDLGDLDSIDRTDDDTSGGQQAEEGRGDSRIDENGDLETDFGEASDSLSADGNGTAMLAIDRFDVDGDGAVRPRDVLALIIFLNEQAELQRESVERVDLANEAVFAEFGHFDTNQDGRISPIDVLQIIQYLDG